MIIALTVIASIVVYLVLGSIFANIKWRYLKRNFKRVHSRWFGDYAAYDYYLPVDNRCRFFCPVTSFDSDFFLTFDKKTFAQFRDLDIIRMVALEEKNQFILMHIFVWLFLVLFSSITILIHLIVKIIGGSGEFFVKIFSAKRKNRFEMME